MENDWMAQMNQKEFLGKKLRKLREERLGISADKLGEMLRPARSGKTVLSWERGRTEPDGNYLIQLCVIFGAEISDFYFKPPSYVDAVAESANDPHWVEVPLFGSIAAGTPIEMISVEDTFVIPRTLRDSYPKSFLLRVVGESMNKKLPNGSYALIDPCETIEHNGRPYAVCVNGFDATIKRVRRLENGFELVPDSTDPTFRPKVYDYGDEDTDTITVIGEVVWCVYPFDYEF